MDAFCGTSTMLIERSYISKCDLTGVDIDSKAIEYSYIIDVQDVKTYNSFISAYFKE